jgi:hypothetical protein
MQVLLADEFGFCFGVERAVQMVEKAIGEGDTVRALGPLIHNAQEMERLEKEGVATISEPVQIKRSETAVIRAHGVTPEVDRDLPVCDESSTARFPRCGAGSSCRCGRKPGSPGNDWRQRLRSGARFYR